MPQRKVLGLKPDAGSESCRQQTGALSDEFAHADSDASSSNDVMPSQEGCKRRCGVTISIESTGIVSPWLAARANIRERQVNRLTLKNTLRA